MLSAIPIRTWYCSLGLGLVIAAGCTLNGTQADPFATYTDQFGRNLVGDSNSVVSGPGGTSAATVFRQDLTLTLTNVDPDYDLNTQYAAWVLPSSFTTADQQDQLLTAGYVQLTASVAIGSVFSLPVGTFVWNGPGNAGTTRVTIPHGTSAGGTATASIQSVTLPTPDVLLVYLAPPTSCDSPAFVYTQEGFPGDVFTFNGGDLAQGNANLDGTTKTLAQIDAYQCGDATHAFMPGLFLRRGGGTRDANQYFEGNNIRFDFVRANANHTSVAAHVTFGG